MKRPLHYVKIACISSGICWSLGVIIAFEERLHVPDNDLEISSSGAGYYIPEAPIKTMSLMVIMYLLLPYILDVNSKINISIFKLFVFIEYKEICSEYAL